MVRGAWPILPSPSPPPLPPPPSRNTIEPGRQATPGLRQAMRPSIEASAVVGIAGQMKECKTVAQEGRMTRRWAGGSARATLPRLTARQRREEAKGIGAARMY